MIFLDQMVKDPWRVQSAVKYTSIARVQRSGLLTRVSEVRGLATLRLPGRDAYQISFAVESAKR